MNELISLVVFVMFLCAVIARISVAPRLEKFSGICNFHPYIPTLHCSSCYTDQTWHRLTFSLVLPLTRIESDSVLPIDTTCRERKAIFEHSLR